MIEILDLIISCFPDPVRKTNPYHPWMMLATIFRSIGMIQNGKDILNNVETQAADLPLHVLICQRGISSSSTPSLAYLGHRCSFKTL